MSNVKRSFSPSAGWILVQRQWLIFFWRPLSEQEVGGAGLPFEAVTVGTTWKEGGVCHGGVGGGLMNDAICAALLPTSGKVREIV